MHFAAWYEEIWGYEPFPWQARLAERFAAGEPPDSIAAPTASGKTSIIDAWVWALAYHPDKVSARLWYVVQRRVLVDDAFKRAQRIRSQMPASTRKRLASLSATSEPLNVRRLRGGVFEDLGAFDVSSPMVVCSTADQHLSRLLFRGYGVADNSLAIHAALAGTRATIAIDEAHILPTYEANLHECVKLGADFRVISMTATPATKGQSVLHLEADDLKHPILSGRISKVKPASLEKGNVSKLPKHVKQMLSKGCRSLVVFCNSVAVAAETAASVPNAWLLTGRMREYDRQRMEAVLEPLRSGAPPPAKPVVIVATQTLEVGADLDFEGLVTECASLSALRQRFGRLNRLGQYENCFAAICWDGKKQAPVYGESAGNVFRWLGSACGEAPDMSTASIQSALTATPAVESLDPVARRGPLVNDDLLETWRQTNPRPLWDVPVSEFIDPSDDTTVMLVWRNEPLKTELVEGLPPHAQEAAPVPIGALRTWAEDRNGIRWRGPGTASECSANELRPGDVWVLKAGEDDGRLALGCALKDSPADVADIPGERMRASAQLTEVIAEGASVEEISEKTGISDPVVTARGDGYVIQARRKYSSLSSLGPPVDLGEHSQAVADLAALMAEKLGLDSSLLRAAGMLHDIGKADQRMQVWMGAVEGQLLAKSGQSPRALSALRPETLPSGWRHELLSARMLPKDASADLVNLVATHHGRCRPAPPPYADDGTASIDYAKGHYSASPTNVATLECQTIGRFANAANPWMAALCESVLMMADRMASRDGLRARIQECSVPRSVAPRPTGSFLAPALDGMNLLGWMAAVGALRVLSKERQTYLHWNEENRAVFEGWSVADAVEVLAEKMKNAPPVSKPTNLEEFALMGIWGPAVWRLDNATFKQSPLLATGGGQTGLERAWPKLAAAMTSKKIEEALVGPWVYYKKYGQRWDTAEHAEHGSQWADPSKDGATSVHGASRLAIEALPLMPTLSPRTTVGFDRTLQAATWPLWRAPLSLRGVRIAIRQPMRERFYSRKISVGQLASFLPAEPRERSGVGGNAATARGK